MLILLLIYIPLWLDKNCFYFTDNTLNNLIYIPLWLDKNFTASIKKCSEIL